MSSIKWTLGILCICFLRLNSTASGKPDVLLIVVDDLRPMLGCYGDSRIQTPRIDQLANQGLVFEHAYCQYAKCGTSRLSLLTGLRPNAIKVFSNNARDVARFRDRRPDAVSFPRWLKQHGYHTQSFGKIYHDGWDSADDWSAPSSPGRDREMLEIVDEEKSGKPTRIAQRYDCPVLQQPDVPDNHLFAGRMTDQVIKVMQQPVGVKPRLLAVGYRRPHLPFIAPQRYFDLYNPDKSWLAKNPLPSVQAPIMSWFNSDGYVGSAKRIGLTMPPNPNRQQAIDWNGYELRSYVGVPNSGAISPEKQLELLQAYAACVTYVDTQIGRLLDALASTPRAKNTIVILFSDHGWHLGEQSAWGKMTNFEIATRVPLIMSGPSVSVGRTKTIAELVDIYPTVCRLAGIPCPEHLQGESLATILGDPNPTKSESIALSQYSRFRNRYMGTALRTQRYRFVRWVEQQSGIIVHRELYDHQHDPNETQNIAGHPEQAKVTKRLEALLLRQETR